MIPSIISAGSSIGQAAIAHRAEGKGQQQLQQGYQQAINTYQPYNQLGIGAANTLAGYLGVPQVDLAHLPQGAMPGQATNMPLFAEKMRDRVNAAQAAPGSESGGTLAAILARRQPEALRNTSRLLPSGSSAGRSSYSTRKAV